MNTAARITAAALAAGVVGVGYAAGVELRRWTLRRPELPVLAPGTAPLRVLHISDLHLVPGQRSKQRFVAGLAGLAPDLVVNTGDNLAHPQAVPQVLRALGPLLDLPGLFVFGSNDYYGPQPKNPLRYLSRPGHHPARRRPLPSTDLRDALSGRGWVDLTHLRHTLQVAGLRVAAAGVDDPHLRRDRYARVAGPPDAQADLKLGLTHSPEPRVLDAFAADGYDLVLAGHTHGGQLRVPGFGALVTNCGLDRGRARGASRWGARMWLNVSAGLGTSPYAPVRFACPPEASLLTLVPRVARPLAAAPTRSGARGGLG